MKKNNVVFFILIYALFIAPVFAKNPVFSMDTFIKEVLKNSLEYQQIQAQKTSALKPLFLAKARLDWSWTAGTGKGRLEQKPFAPTDPSLQENNSFFTGLEKSFLTGTHLKIQYSHLFLENEFPQNTPALAPESAKEDFKLGIEQDLIRNIFGYEDRTQLNIAKRQVEMAQIKLAESTEDLILKAVSQFWESYISQLSLYLKKRTRDDYRSLAKITRSKNRIGYVRPGELGQILAELEKAKQEWLLQKTDYEDKVQSLLNLLNNTKYKQLILKPKSFPSAPPVINDKLNKTPRTVELLRKNLMIYEEELKQQKSARWPRLKLYGSYGLIGQGPKFDQAMDNFKESNNYSYGIKIHYPIPSSSVRRKRTAIHQEQVTAGELDLEITKKEFNRQIKFTKDNLNTLYTAVKSSKKIYKLRSQSYKQIRKAYLQGRLNVFELISAKTKSQSSEIEHAILMGQYYKAFAYAQALRDNLIKQYTP